MSIKNEKQTLEVTSVSDIESLSVRNKVFGYEERLASTLNSRHIGMITLVGVFGTGLFLSSGGSLSTAGPVGVLLCYFFIGLVVLASQMCATETACLMPVTFSYIKHSNHFISQSFGFAVGWTNIYAAIMPSELSAVAVIMTYWSSLNPAVWVAVFGIVVVATNCYKIRWYGEIEFFFGCLKILLVLGLILIGLIIDLGGVPGQDRIGFRYWKEGAFNWKYFDSDTGRFIAFWKTLNSVVYSYGGVQGIALLAGEVEYPRRAIHRAAKRVFARCFLMYMSTIFVLTLIVSSKDPLIASSTGNAAGSPFVVAIRRAGIKVLPHIINGVVLTSALSATNLGVLQSSRALFALASIGQAPKIFLKTNRKGMPYYALLVSVIFLPLAFMSASHAASTVFSWFQSITSSHLLVNWITISLNHIRMSKAMKVQGYTREDLPYSFPGTTYASWFSLFFSTLLLLTGGFTNFIHGKFYFPSFFSAYFIIPLGIVLGIFWGIVKKSFLIKPEDVDLKTLFDDVKERPEPEYPKLKGWQWLTLLWA
ncbi:putative dicarboxylic amino acid permease [Clavispora lusitaniae]|uniref:Amino acid permease/ SLC12A domain-containing protein n=3 Tax=Clavispora lusitaniae TaxID=36911 RepID=C4Y116_CLAL4|nr:uncharacterized protein CLUG_01898 [Clavispora lusitaniae ATCC 42720]KAF5211890.1 hypothetical protein E0198_001436 [Clavispora lusitaniae]EEQ37775.1 hypothetical protein CLUG_01898 [Clavispora lusitaniae ATCC 42720]KAF7583276.1 Amino acid permease family protein [Clavispora lusitaniae]OVF10573.1 putative dicarboxylic amino acid permease [Clavispora lusitaniae]QFZ26772.1 putative dicarboxylic amino acid permease [Clavispora lusitaniae]